MKTVSGFVSNAERISCTAFFMACESPEPIVSVFCPSPEAHTSRKDAEDEAVVSPGTDATLMGGNSAEEKTGLAGDGGDSGLGAGWLNLQRSLKRHAAP